MLYQKNLQIPYTVTPVAVIGTSPALCQNNFDIGAKYHMKEVEKNLMFQRKNAGLDAQSALVEQDVVL